MTSASEVPTSNRVELEDGRWCELRRLNLGDIAAAKYEAHGRGFEDADLDAIFLLRGSPENPSLVVKTSDGEPTVEFVNSLTEMDFGRVWLKAKGMDSPKPSAPSSSGTRRSRGGSNRTSG